MATFCTSDEINHHWLPFIHYQQGTTCGICKLNVTPHTPFTLPTCPGSPEVNVTVPMPLNVTIEIVGNFERAWSDM